MFLDVEQTFDRVGHEVLMAKLSAYGIFGVPHHWLRTYLKERQYYCSGNVCNSTC